MIRRRNMFCYLMVAPALILVLVLSIYPMLDSLRMSFLQYDLLRIRAEGTPFVGFQNYQTLLENPRFIQTLINTLIFVVIVVGIVVILGLLISQVLHINFRGRSVVRMLVLVPWFIPPVVASMIWLWMFQPDRSPINQVLRGLGVLDYNIRYLTDTATLGPLSIPMMSVSMVRVWTGLPFTVVMILAGLQSLPTDIYEAASIDGASRVQKFFSLTLPLLMPVLSILITLLVIGGIGHFEINYIMTGGGPQDLTNILAVSAYQQAFVFYRFDLGSAMSSIILVMTSVIAFFYIRGQIREEY